MLNTTTLCRREQGTARRETQLSVILIISSECSFRGAKKVFPSAHNKSNFSLCMSTKKKKWWSFSERYFVYEKLQLSHENDQLFCSYTLTNVCALPLITRTIWLKMSASCWLAAALCVISFPTLESTRPVLSLWGFILDSRQERRSRFFFFFCPEELLMWRACGVERACDGVFVRTINSNMENGKTLSFSSRPCARLSSLLDFALKWLGTRWPPLSIHNS